MSYLIAFYEIDRAYDGPEEGGWWYDTGQLVRAVRVEKSEDRAYALCRRANRLLDHLQRSHRSVNSVAYSGGRHAAQVFPNTAPLYYPETTPSYE